MTFRIILRAARRSAGISQAELARRVGVTKRAVQYWEQSSRKPIRAETIARIADALGFSPKIFTDFPPGDR